MVITVIDDGSIADPSQYHNYLVLFNPSPELIRLGMNVNSIVDEGVPEPALGTIELRDETIT
jgi:hypothetical protein